MAAAAAVAVAVEAVAAVVVVVAAVAAEAAVRSRRRARRGAARRAARSSSRCARRRARAALRCRPSACGGSRPPWRSRACPTSASRRGSGPRTRRGPRADACCSGRRTSITSVRGTRTMTEGARIREVFLRPAPVTPSTGRAVSTPRYATTPPTAPVLRARRQVARRGSAAVATRRKIACVRTSPSGPVHESRRTDVQPAGR